MSYDCEFEKILNEARHYYKICRYEQAINKLDESMAIKPNDNYTLYKKASCLFYLNKYNEAEEYCREALNYGFSICECNYLLGLIFMHTNQYIKAEECFLESLRENPHRADIIATYGYLMLDTGNYRKSDKLMKEALRIDSQNETVLHYRFYYYLVKNKSEDQVKILQEYLQVADSEVSKFIKIGMVEFYCGNYKGARENFKQAFLLDPTDENILTILQSAEKGANILFLPQRIIDKLGGPVMIWIAMIITVLVLQELNLSNVVLLVSIFYIGICVYTWIIPYIYKFITKYR
ncbi:MULTISPECIES: tetratricopeptide repeat protein [Clostridium]|uniref:Tetratricopeptide repeat protein n=1 Tax=Clostridium butyricum TaxID=1492 RepID=A0AAP9UES2_CLOBU|nr:MULTISPECIES: tetratricopeptide repeat protein [Clostridium]EMU55339.1 hypothetical protein CBDKU1_07650 [Clostridium butyricum DKU-01]MBZ0314322.1 tetratricopeptide repeat protein [Clostridium butyricum]MBZ5746751.1 tetratricopeptide repeat protein [Clostridium butyricum]MDI9208265.1 tetratricopeptide repeat protein [Clostridium butyricum]MDU4589558.1 tetratricopeptide repeat protein [Clostridium sp.]